MSRPPGRRSIDATELFEHERAIVEVSSGTQARMLSRAKVALRTREYALAKVGPSPKPSTFRWAAAASLVGLGIVVGGAAAYQLAVRAHQQTVLPAAPKAEVSVLPDTSTPKGMLPDTPTPKGMATPTIERARAPIARSIPSSVTAASEREELRILQPARAAVERKDFAAAMSPIAEHARRFKSGRLAEEREALRVKALVGLGRYVEARRAAAAFALRFPRSPLLPAIMEISASNG